MTRFLFIGLLLAVSAFGINLKSFLTYTFDANKDYDFEKGKELYFKNKCNSCHGDNAEKSVSGSKMLKDMKPEEIKSSLIGYSLDGSTSSNAAHMAIYSSKISHNDIDNIIAYIKGANFAVDLQIKDLKEEEPAQKTKHNTFLK